MNDETVIEKINKKEKDFIKQCKNKILVCYPKNSSEEIFCFKLVTIVDFKLEGDFLLIKTRQGKDEPWFCQKISPKHLENLEIFPGLIHKIDIYKENKETIAKRIKCIEKSIEWKLTKEWEPTE